MRLAPASARPTPELVIAGRYRVESLLGQGGMGAVYAATDSATGKQLALKRLTLGASAAMAALFEREYHTLAGLKHPCIVEVYDYGHDEGGQFYTMELIDGRDLSKAAPMAWRDVCRDLRDVASILGLLHARHLLHRDLSPRNLLRSQSGRLKLIDFGALASFGISKELVGTPPFVAPEALRAAPLDQRTDLFALGALGYWLLTAVHAYPARSLGELPALWQREPMPPSELRQLAGRVDNDVREPIPAELDGLLAALLRVEPAERLASTAELIDQLNAIAGLEPEANDATVQGYLDSKAFVGRKRELERALSLLSEAKLGHARSLLVEGDAGVGRTRFLQELAVVTRLAGAIPVCADASLGTRPYAVAESLLRGLLTALPQPTREAVADEAALLGTISKELRGELRVGGRPSMVHAPGETRVRLLAALREVVIRISSARCIVLLVDDLQAIDEESQALLATLAHEESELKLLLIVAHGRESKREAASAVAHIRNKATRVRLLPLDGDETRELLRSVFGQARYLERLAERLYKASEGNPAYTLELAEHLVQSGAARYEDGAWSLPAELPLESLPHSRQAAHVARLERLSIEARELARSLSVPHSGPLTHDHSFAVSERPPKDVHALLDELVREGVLRVVPDGHRFLHNDVKAALCGELSAEGRARAHLSLGEEVTAAGQGQVLEELRAAVHFLRGADLKRGYACLQRAVAFYEQGDVGTLGTAAPMFEDIYLLLRDLKQDDYGLSSPLAMLALAGYFADRRYASRYGDRALALLRVLLRLDLAQRLSRWLGARLGLIAALLVAGVSLRLRWRRAPSLTQATRHLMGAGAALAGTAATCIDPASVLRYAAALRPFAVLGKNHAASVTHEFTSNLVLQLRDHPAGAAEIMRAFFERLQSPKPIRDLPDGVKANYAAGTLLTLGIIASWRDTKECLQIADQLEQFGPLYSMNADHLRACYYAAQGDLARSESYRKRVEVHAVQLGSAWQVETWAPADALKNALRLHDAALMKRTVQEVARLSSEIPSLALTERHARGSYLMLRGKFAEAIPLLDDDQTPGEIVGWSRARGALACAYNGLGDHARAKEVCLEVMSVLDQGDLDYVVLNLTAQTELAMAESGLGNPAVARYQLDKLLARHTPNSSPVTLGWLHHARSRVALREQDYVGARDHLGKMEAHFRSTAVPTLIELVSRLRRELDRSENPRATGPDSDGRLDQVQHMMTRVQLMLSQQSGALVPERAQKGLQVALELSSADEGFIVLAESMGAPVAHLGNAAPSSELVLWAEQNLLDANFDEQTVMTEAVHSDLDSNYKVVGQMRYCVVPLWVRRDHEDQVVAALVLGFDNRVPEMPEAAVMRAIADHLVDTEQRPS